MPRRNEAPKRHGVASPRESSVVRSIKERFAKIGGVKVIKILGGRGMEAGTPDLVGVAWGRAIALEVKRDAQSRPTELQKFRLKQWRDAGAVTAVVRSVDEALEVLRLIRSETDDPNTLVNQT